MIYVTKKEDNGNCIYGLYHGSAGSMEIHNALILFKRSTQWGFRYTNFISDGDSKVYPELRKANIYDVDIGKMECGNHMVKRAVATVYKFGSKYTGKTTEVTPVEVTPAENSSVETSQISVMTPPPPPPSPPAPPSLSPLQLPPKPLSPGKPPAKQRKTVLEKATENTIPITRFCVSTKPKKKSDLTANCYSDS